MANKTIKQIADELCLDKQKVYRYIKKNHINEVNQNESVKYYDEAAQKLIKEGLQAKVNTSNDTMIESLMKQLETKDKQIEQLQKLLNQEQQLHLRTQEKLFLLEDKNISEEAAAAEPEKKWWQKIFS